jgi:NADH-ubiquinone oxidoreductase chain 3
MTSTTFFFVFIPLLAVILLAVNLIFAPHNPYQEKDSVFECGFHSFLGQNRTQFSISFFVFALLFLLFDLEILLVYPYVVSAYANSIYGLVIMLIFFLVLTLGFAFELGKNALKIDSRQMVVLFNNKTSVVSSTSHFKSYLKTNVSKVFSLKFLIAILSSYGFNILAYLLMKYFTGINILTTDSLGYITIIYFILTITLTSCLTTFIISGFSGFKAKFRSKELITSFLCTIFSILTLRCVFFCIRNILLASRDIDSDILLDYTEISPYILLIPVIGAGAYSFSYSYDNFMQYALDSVAFKLKGRVISQQEFISYAASRAPEGTGSGTLNQGNSSSNGQGSSSSSNVNNSSASPQPVGVKSINEMLDTRQAEFETAEDILGDGDPETIEALLKLKYAQRLEAYCTKQEVQSEDPSVIRQAVSGVLPRDNFEANERLKILNRLPNAVPAAPNAVPVAPNAVPVAPNAVPVAPNAVPVAPNAVPVAPNAVPVATRPPVPLFPSNNSSSSGSNESSSSSDIKSNVDNKRSIDQTDNHSASDDTYSKKRK